MAGRIRTIKPEVLEDEVASALSDAAWRLWVSMWVLADDHGNLRSSGKFLAANVWQDTTRDPSEPFAELVRKGFAHPYRVSGQSYCHIKSWQKHQKIHNPGSNRVPPPEHASANDQQLTLDSSEELRDGKKESEDVADSTSESDRVETSPTVSARARAPARGGPPTSDLDPDPDQDPDQRPTTKIGASAVAEVCAHWVSQPYHSKTPVLAEQHRRVVRARLRDGFSVADLKTAITNWEHDDWLAGRTKDRRPKRGLVEILQNADRVNRLAEIGLETSEAGDVPGVEATRRMLAAQPSTVAPETSS